MNYAIRILSCFLLALSFGIVSAQSTISLSGRIIADDLSPLMNAGVYVAQFSLGTTSDSSGRFQVNVKPGWNDVSFSYVGYLSETVKLYLTRDTAIHIKLKTNLQLNEVTIIDRKQIINALHEANGTITLRKENFTSLPAFLGENDPMRAVQMQPGIFIRGGSPDQNLMLIDGASVYNPAHIYGFISVFNGDAIDHLDVYKDHYPARFGGRLCSVIDVTVSEGDTAKLKGSFSLGFVTSRLHLTGPFTKKKKTTFTLALRGSYIGLYTVPISRRQYRASGFDGSIAYYFGDVNAKVVHRFTNKTRMEFNFFTNNDYYSFDRQYASQSSNYEERGLSDHSIQWANYVASTSLVHEFDDQWQMKQHFSFSRYHIINKDIENYSQTLFQGGGYDSKSSSKTQSFINDFTWREDATYTTQQQTFMMGAGVSALIFETGKGNYAYSSSNVETEVDKLEGSRFKTYDAFVYVEDEYHPHEHWMINGGFHVRVYNVQKKTFVSFLPRVNVLYNPVAKFYLRGSASGLSQNLHLLATATTNILNDYWVPATAKAKPENGWNFSGGMTQKLPLNFEWSIDAFYRVMNNVIEYKEGNEQASIYTPWETQITAEGRGRSYGTEFYIARTKGKLTGSVAYTLSWSERKFKDINKGKYYPYKYDRRHNLAAQLTYLIGKHFEVGTAFVYGSGSMYSSPVQSFHTYGIISSYDFQLAQGSQNPYYNDIVTIYSGKNNARLPAYQHLDVSFTYRKRKKNLEHAFNLSVYNVYNNFNIFQVYSDYRTNEDGTRSMVYKQLSLFPVLPSLSYTIKFT
ncbi:MAG: carboxypeptidase-like regulatory domain-containing protein [Bacteroidota bacterium]